MCRTVRTVLFAAASTMAAFATSPSFAFDVQSGGVALSAQSAALLASRLMARNEPAQPKSAVQAGMATGPAGGPAVNGPTRDERMMSFMLGGQPGARANGATDGLADVKAALRSRR